MEVFYIPFMQQALVAGLLIGVTCSLLAVFVVLKKIVFVGAALAQLSSAGVAMALLFGLSPMLCSFVFMILGVAIFAVRFSERRLPKESIIGIGYVTATALGILLVAKSAQGESHMLNLLFGNILAITPKDTYLLVAVFVGVMLIHYLFHKEFLISSFDPETAETLGVKAKFWDLLFYLVLGAVIAVGIRIVGVLLVFSFLVIPGVTALLLANRLRKAMLISVLASIIPVVAGLYLSFVLDIPSAATIVAMAFVLLCMAVPASKLIRV